VVVVFFSSFVFWATAVFFVSFFPLLFSDEDSLGLAFLSFTDPSFFTWVLSFVPLSLFDSDDSEPDSDPEEEPEADAGRDPEREPVLEPEPEEEEPEAEREPLPEAEREAEPDSEEFSEEEEFSDPEDFFSELDGEEDS